MTICHLVNYGGLTGGSFIPAMQALAHAVTSRGDRFVLLARRFSGATWWHDLRAAGVDLRLLGAPNEVIIELTALRPDIIHTHFSAFDILALRGGNHARVFWHVHSIRQDYSLRARANAFVKYRLIGRRVQIVAVSNVLREECIAFYAPETRIHVIHNGVDMDYFRPGAPEERAAARRKYGIGVSDRVVLFFERLPLKGGSTLRKALNLLVGIRLLVVGGSKEDRDLFGSAPDVISISRVSDTRELYWASDVLAFPSEREGFGFVVAEALACSLPIAASAIPIIQEVFGNADGVKLFPVRDAASMALAITNALSDKINHTGRQRAVTDLSLRRWTKRILDLYEH